jgi:hypothetical protein
MIMHRVVDQTAALEVHGVEDRTGPLVALPDEISERLIMHLVADS